MQGRILVILDFEGKFPIERLPMVGRDPVRVFTLVHIPLFHYKKNNGNLEILSFF